MRFIPFADRTLKRIHYTPLITLLILILIGSSSVEAAKKKRKYEKPEGTFQLMAQTRNGRMMRSPLPNSNIIFNGNAARFNAYVGCNTISAAMSLQRKQLRLGQMIRTEKACPNALDSIETLFIQNLEQVNAYRWDGNTLILMHKKVPVMKLRGKK